MLTPFTEAWRGLAPRSRYVLVGAVAALVASTLLLGVVGGGSPAGWRVWLATLLDLPVRVGTLLVLAWAWRKQRAGRLGDPILLLAMSVALDLWATLLFRFPMVRAALAEGGIPVADFVQLLSHLSLLGALLALPKESEDAHSRLVSALDASAAVGGFGLLTWFYLIRPAPQLAGLHGTWGVVAEVAYPVLDVAIVLALWSRSQGAAPWLSRPFLRGLDLAVAGVFVGDAAIGLDLYVIPHAGLSVVAAVAFALGTAGLLLIGLASTSPVTRSDAEAPVQLERTVSPFGIVAVGVALFAMIREQLQHLDRADLTLSVGGALLSVIVLLRQLLVAQRNERWMAGQQRLLAQEVSARTAELAAANARLVMLASHDPLTGLANRRRFDEELERAWAASMRSGQPLAVLLVDVDLFKAYNDHYGHPAGDRCLAVVAQRLRAEAPRQIDLVARYGGEEFVVLCPTTDAPGAQVLAARMCQAVRNAGLPHERSTVAPNVTVSIGVAARVPALGEKATRIVAEADAALYEAKRAGRDRVMFIGGGGRR